MTQPDTPTFTYKTAVRWVFGQMHARLRQAIIDFWVREGALTNVDEAWRRTWEVACVLQDNEGYVVGVCTVALGVDDAQRGFGFVRIFVGKAHRQPGVAVSLMRRMVEGFENLAHEPGAPKRLLATIENGKLAQRGGLRMLASVGFHAIGQTPDGQLLVERPLSV